MLVSWSSMDYKKAADIELWHCCQDDDIKAYNELFERYSQKVYSVCYYYLQDIVVAEEIALDVMFWLWQKRHTTIIHKGLSPYLHQASRHAVISYRRKQSSNILVLQQDYAEETVADSRTADYDLLCTEENQRYQQLLDELSPQRRTVFVLSREENLTYTEIAQKTSLSINTIENYMVACLKHFRRCIVTAIVILSIFF